MGLESGAVPYRIPVRGSGQFYLLPTPVIRKDLVLPELRELPITVLIWQGRTRNWAIDLFRFMMGYCVAADVDF